MILIIDDDIAVRTSLILLMESEGFKVTATANPGDALAIIKKQSPDLVILDLNFRMPPPE
jgi:DNA-binding response OmpR family regulator